MIDHITNAVNRLGFSDAYNILKSYYKSRIVILMYHKIGPNKYAWLYPSTTISDFEKQMRYLSRTFKILPLNKLAEQILKGRPLSKKVAVVTFDDGYRDNYRYAFPILKKYKIPATVFLITGHINTDNMFWFDKIRYLIWYTKLKRLELDGFGDFSLNSMKNRSHLISRIIEKFKKIPDKKKNYLLEELVNISDVDIPCDIGRDIILSWDQVKEMNEGRIDFGAHTVTHPILTRISPDQAKFEITQSKRDIEKRLNQSVDTFSYPNGAITDFNNNIIDIVKESRFTCAVTTIPTMNPSRTNLYKLGRLPTPLSYESFKLYVSGFLTDMSNILNRFRGSNVY